MPTRLTLAVVACMLASTASAQDFSPGPLATPSAFPDDSLPRDPKQFTEWLVNRGPKVTPSERQVIVEHIYALIGERLRQTPATRDGQFPTGDSTLADLYTLADYMGVAGAWDVARAIGVAEPRAFASPTDSAFDLSFDAPLFTLASAQGRWVVRFPYYFMIGATSRQMLANGGETDVATLSTLTAANHPAGSGASQATILLLSTQTGDLPSFTAFWLERLQLTTSDASEAPAANAVRAYRRQDEGMWRELVVFRISSGTLLAAYIGRDGTYQANRDHFVDLLSALRVR